MIQRKRRPIVEGEWFQTKEFGLCYVKRIATVFDTTVYLVMDSNKQEHAIKIREFDFNHKSFMTKPQEAYITDLEKQSGIPFLGTTLQDVSKYITETSQKLKERKK